MRTLVAIVFFAAAGPALAGPPAASVDAPRYVCERGSLSRAALRAEAASCCVGQFGCPQLLSNTGLVKPKRDNRT